MNALSTKPNTGGAGPTSFVTAANATLNTGANAIKNATVNTANAMKNAASTVVNDITTQLNEIIVLKYLINIKPKIKLGICCLLETAVLRTNALSLILIG